MDLEYPEMTKPNEMQGLHSIACIQSQVSKPENPELLHDSLEDELNSLLLVMCFLLVFEYMVSHRF